MHAVTTCMKESRTAENKADLSLFTPKAEQLLSYEAMLIESEEKNIWMYS